MRERSRGTKEVPSTNGGDLFELHGGEREAHHQLSVHDVAIMGPLQSRNEKENDKFSQKEEYQM